MIGEPETKLTKLIWEWRDKEKTIMDCFTRKKAIHCGYLEKEQKTTFKFFTWLWKQNPTKAIMAGELDEVRMMQKYLINLTRKKKKKKVIVRY